MFGTITSANVACKGCGQPLGPSGNFTIVGSDWFHAYCYLDPKPKPDVRSILYEDYVAAIRKARNDALEAAEKAISAIADEEMPEPYFDNARGRRMDWACAVGRCMDRVRALANPTQGG